MTLADVRTEHPLPLTTPVALDRCRPPMPEPGDDADPDR